MPESISKDTAGKIVSVLKDSINHDITFMDTTGHIIACTDAKRVGNMHSGSIALLQGNLPMLAVYNDYDYPGTRRGVNMPLTFHGHIIGVVGITGEVDEVERFGKMIKRMTELLLLENEYKMEADRRRYNVKHFLQRWIQRDTVIDEAFIAFGLRLGIDISVPRRAVVGNLTSPKVTVAIAALPQEYDLNRRLNHIICRLFGDDYSTLWCISGQRLILLLRDANDVETNRHLQELQAAIEEEADLEVTFGCDGVATSGKDVCEGYQRALLALSAACGTEIRIYNDIDLAMLIRYIPKEVKSEFVKKIFHGCSRQQIDEWCEFIDTLTTNNGAITAVARQLYVHKNTVQYRIAKLESVSGYDYRLLQDFPTLYLASLLWREMRDG